MWKGGITRDDIRKSIQYKEWRSEVFKRDDYTCMECRARGKEIHAHHIKSMHRRPDLALDVNNGLTLCADCHRKTDNYGHKALIKS